VAIVQDCVKEATRREKGLQIDDELQKTFAVMNQVGRHLALGGNAFEDVQKVDYKVLHEVSFPDDLGFAVLLLLQQAFPVLPPLGNIAKLLLTAAYTERYFG